MPIDNRTKKLAKIVVNYSLSVKHDENVVISGSIEASDFVVALYGEILKVSAHPILRLTLPELSHIFYKYAKNHHIEKYPEIFDYTVKNAQKYIGIDTESNTRELSSADPKKLARRGIITRPISDYIVNEKSKIRRVTVAYPCIALAQEAEMSLSEFEDFVFGATILDWKKLGEEIDK
ncbi:MAG: aminopeptidase [Candidatus Berkelbacteria bacterium Athens1014_28]|uniref:Aminopeptidase n=1 Tax=Candidatus Berkelbacteria bacterium Athens1014_28 TaxID=2017145 RepID=A0A554LPC2_9BACT|nr:MAG: aminopeptidase [Candidatus Berkelbacteria bacterium Athens1014_28]